MSDKDHEARLPRVLETGLNPVDGGEIGRRERRAAREHVELGIARWELGDRERRALLLNRR